MSPILFSGHSGSDRPRVLVLLAAYNGAAWLEEQIDSILMQEEVDLSIVVSDDASRDDTVALISSRWAHDQRVSLIGWPESSGSAGANFRRLYRKVDAGDFDFIALADQDDLWLPGKLRRAIQCLDQHRAQGYSCAVRAFWPDGREQVFTQSGNLKAADFVFEGAGQGCTFVVRQEFFLKVQEFCCTQSVLVEQLHYHDWLLYLLARTWQMPWYFDTEVGMRYRQHGGNEIGARGSAEAVKRRVAMIRNGWYRTQVKTAGALYQLAGGRHPVVDRMLQLLQPATPVSGWSRVLLMHYVIRHGRRRVSDRAVLGLAALLGWLT